MYERINVLTNSVLTNNALTDNYNMLYALTNCTLGPGCLAREHAVQYIQ